VNRAGRWMLVQAASCSGVRESVSGLIVFDFDNTLVHSKIDFAGIRRELFDMLRASGHADARGDGLVDRLARLSIGEIIDVGVAHDPGFYDAAWQMVLEYETAGMVASTVEPDARSTLHALRDAEFTLAVMTNNARLATLAALDLFDMRSAFQLILTRDEVPMKPDPAGIVKAMATCEAPAGRTVMIGDSWLDGRAAHAAGVPFIGFRPRAGVLDERGVAYWAVVEQLGELVPLVSGPWPAVDDRRAL
jgi:phosphoglycolate phosphatase